MDGSTKTPPRGLFVTGRGFVLPAAIWALYFAASYAIQGAGCGAAFAAGGPEGHWPLRAILLTLTLGAVAAIAASALWSWRTWHRVRPQASGDPAFERGAFLALGTLLNALLFLIATLWIALPVLLFDPCRGHGVW